MLDPDFHLAPSLWCEWYMPDIAKSEMSNISPHSERVGIGTAGVGAAPGQKASAGTEA